MEVARAAVARAGATEAVARAEEEMAEAERAEVRVVAVRAAATAAVVMVAWGRSRVRKRRHYTAPSSSARAASVFRCSAGSTNQSPRGR